MLGLGEFKDIMRESINMSYDLGTGLSPHSKRAGSFTRETTGGYRVSSAIGPNERSSGGKSPAPKSPHRKSPDPRLKGAFKISVEDTDGGLRTSELSMKKKPSTTMNRHGSPMKDRS